MSVWNDQDLAPASIPPEFNSLLTPERNKISITDIESIPFCQFHIKFINSIFHLLFLPPTFYNELGTPINLWIQVL